MEMRLALRVVRRGLARGRVIALDRRGSVDGSGLGHERGRVIRRGGGAIIVRVRVERVTHELPLALAVPAISEGLHLRGARTLGVRSRIKCHDSR